MSARTTDPVEGRTVTLRESTWLALEEARDARGARSLSSLLDVLVRPALGLPLGSSERAAPAPAPEGGA